MKGRKEIGDLMRILLLRTWMVNIGNVFIEKGARSLIEKAVPDSEIIEAGGYSNIIHYKLGHFGEKGNSSNDSDVIPFNTAEYIKDVDVAILPGCVLSWHIKPFLTIFKKLRKKGIPIILLGVGGMSYDAEKVNEISSLVEQIGPSAIITRDRLAFKNYSSIASLSYDGIDCGYFINDYYCPPESDREFIAVTFGGKEEPVIETPYQIVRASHEPLFFSNVYDGVSKTLMRLTRFAHRRSAVKKVHRFPETLISDLVEDYLFLYSNAIEIHTDRVHAGVAGISYGNRVYFHSDSPRKGVIKRLCESIDDNGLLVCDDEYIRDEKNKQIKILRDYINQLVK